jgi:hypothetical protein
MIVVIHKICSPILLVNQLGRIQQLIFAVLIWIPQELKHPRGGLVVTPVERLV